MINSRHIEPHQFLEEASEIVLERVRDNNIKLNTVFNGEFVSSDKRANKNVSTRNYELFQTFDLEEWYASRVIEPILTSLEEFQERDSGWTLSRILNLIFNVNKYNPLHAGCYIELPREIKMKRAVINVQSLSNACFCSYDDSLSKYRFRRGNDCIAWFAEELRNLVHKVNTILSTNVPMADFTRDEWQKFNSVTHCHVYEKPFTSDDTRVRDHCRLIGRFRGPAHSFIDSYKFLASSLEKLASYDSSTYLMYYDVNNLHGWAMCQLPYADFRWVDDVENFNVMDIA
ncbi:hypothetical protein ALC60_14196 [Trachymyrmex zeteki]|uniref:DNA-directed DNA polymerase n=1 Tax=Mycetomoellerius zeteki TaxID=64791 RepID=A0A151WG28_9HYME|nr:hypothetical protein ALC60_14196 [Trachymyrmex zeteki]